MLRVNGMLVCLFDDLYNDAVEWAKVLNSCGQIVFKCDEKVQPPAGAPIDTSA